MPKSRQTPLERVTFSPTEFAALFGKSQTWGYRQIYSGKVKTITEYGRILIPAAEVEQILATAGRYEGTKKKAARTKIEIQTLKPRLQTAWAEYLRLARAGRANRSGKAKRLPASVSANPGAKRAVLRRLSKAGGYS